MTPTYEEVYKKVLDALAKTAMSDGTFADAARAATNIALQEAARVAKHYGSQPSTGTSDFNKAHDSGWDNACQAIAAAIRGLITDTAA
jgi:hypothetical protein